MSEHSRIEDWRRRIDSDPASIAFAALAGEYRRTGRFEEAIAVCAGGLKRHPSYLSAHVTLGRALLETGRLDEARATLEFVLGAAPENLPAIQALAQLNRRVAATGGALFVHPSSVLNPQVQALDSFLAAVRKGR
ncbi:MAG: tetratricopeptide repeat protein [Acidobacteriota bacterium]|nr:tetratricopeptide repeat protein [Acidobacteriota bacterium]